MTADLLTADKMTADKMSAPMDAIEFRSAKPPPGDDRAVRLWAYGYDYLPLLFC